jgi:GNAT superfamily N-acetyltransferase
LQNKEEFCVFISGSLLAMATDGNGSSVVVTVRLAAGKDVSVIAALIRELAVFEKLEHACEVTDSKLESSLWNLPPFQGPTVLILEVGGPRSEEDQHEQEEKDLNFQQQSFEEVVRELKLSSPIVDPDAASFRSTADERRIVAGFVLFFPNYSTFLAKGGFYVEDLYVRKPYRGRGLGTILLKTVVQQAVRLGAGRVEWCVLDWNVDAIKFYQGLGASLLPEWRICRLTGKALESCSL